MLKRLLALAALATATACAGATGSPARRSHNVTPQHDTGRPRDVITAAELQRADTRNTLDAIQALRPEFLMSRRGPLESPPVVYLDGAYQGDLGALRTVPLDVIVEVRYLSAGAASDLFGPFRVRGPVISVRTRS